MGSKASSSNGDRHFLPNTRLFYSIFSFPALRQRSSLPAPSNLQDLAAVARHGPGVVGVASPSTRHHTRALAARLCKCHTTMRPRVASTISVEAEGVGILVVAVIWQTRDCTQCLLHEYNRAQCQWRRVTITSSGLETHGFHMSTHRVV